MHLNVYAFNNVIIYCRVYAVGYMESNTEILTISYMISLPSVNLLFCGLCDLNR